jgi:hypothetical protein
MNSNSGMARAIVAGISAAIGLLAGVLTAGLFLGGTKAHLADRNIHQSVGERYIIARDAIDREVTPTLIRMQYQLDRIEAKIDEREEKGGSKR